LHAGYSRIPVFENERTNIVSMLFIKDLAFIDPDDNTPLRTVSNYYQNALNFVFEDTTLDTIFKEFKEGPHHIPLMLTKFIRIYRLALRFFVETMFINL
jgi:CBS domain containing-hemolysin-like protein